MDKKLHLLLLRDKTSGKDFQFGKLYVDGQLFCETLEDVVREVEGADVSTWKIPGRTAIPRGTYSIIINDSTRFKRRLPLLLKVPGFTGVRIHSGNSSADTEGCLLVGTVRSRDRVLNSRIAFDKLFAILEAAYAQERAITIEVS